MGDLPTVLERRRNRISERIEQLQERERQIEERLMQGPASPKTVAVAREHAAAAEVHMQDERTLAAEGHDRASTLHGGSADLHERVVAVLDEHGRPEAARVHRAAAANDREAAGDQEHAAEEEEEERGPA